MVPFSINDNLEEGQYQEFKEASAGLPKDLWETYSSFANTEGGRIVLGIHEDRERGSFVPVGVPDAQTLVGDFWSTLRNRQIVERDVMLFDGVHVATENGMDFVVIEVPRAERGEKPVRVYDRRQKKFVAWIRRGEGDFEATEDDLRLMSYDGISGADRKPLERFGQDSLDENTIRRYRNVFAGAKPQNPWNNDSTEDFLYHIGALAKGRDGLLHPTQAGLLAFGFEYEITNYAPQYLLDYREEGLGNLRWKDRVVSQSGDWSGNLIDFYFAVTGRLLRHFKMPFSTDSTGTQHGSTNVITEATNEALVNALIHAFYGSSGGSIRIILNESSLTISNPGSLLVDRDVAIAGGYSETRNPTLMRIFSFIGASDRAGSGLQRIWSTWNEVYDSAPSLEERHSPASVTLTMPLDITPIRQRTFDFSSTIPEENSLLALISNTPGGFTPHELQEALGISLRVAQGRLKSLFDQKLLTRKKDGRFWRYLAR